MGVSKSRIEGVGRLKTYLSTISLSYNLFENQILFTKEYGLKNKSVSESQYSDRI